jgi:hypothetical protein
MQSSEADTPVPLPSAAAVRRLDRPDPEAIGDAFRELPRRAALEIACRWDALRPTLAAAEQCGCIAVEIHPGAKDSAWRITALKGKSGPCFETGRSATYLGGAAAALDDDGHLLFGEMRVCEKTGGLYALPPYAGLIRVSAADPALLARLEADPLPFDCNTFERDAAALARRLGRQPATGGEAGAAMYSGPFRLLVLQDGTMLRRGEPLLLTELQRASLGAGERLLPLVPPTAARAGVPDNFVTRYEREGAICLLAALRTDTSIGTSGTIVPPGQSAPDFSAIDRTSASVRRRLNRLIDRSAPYCILSGSDPRDTDGCCPSDDVGEANRLVEAGVLCRYAPPSHPDACTMAFYAFAGEIRLEPSAPMPSFTPNSAIRDAVKARLTR